MKIRQIKRWFRRAFYLCTIIAVVSYFTGNIDNLKIVVEDLSNGDFTSIRRTYESMPRHASSVGDWFDGVKRDLTKGSANTFVVRGESYDPIYGPPTEVYSRFNMDKLDNGPWKVGYSNTLGSPAWVSYRAVATDKHKSDERPDTFVVDRRTDLKVDTSRYTRSGYDRGHLFPNYLASVCFGTQAQEDSFLMSNISPQLPDFNRKIWKLLEQKVGYDYRHQYGEVHVVTGPYYNLAERNPILIGGGYVRVPEGFWKIILVENRKGKLDALAFMMPQYATGENLGRYLVSIDDIEAVTGLDIFPNLLIEDALNLEGKKASGMWR